jgi:hypothetical protein
MRYRHLMLTLLLTGTAALSGCYQSTDVSLHEPGEYKGKKDPLLAYEGSAEQQQKLLERFKQVQTDR